MTRLLNELAKKNVDIYKLKMYLHNYSPNWSRGHKVNGEIGKTAFELAVDSGSVEVVDLLYKKGMPITDMMAVSVGLENFTKPKSKEILQYLKNFWK